MTKVGEGIEKERARKRKEQSEKDEKRIEEMEIFLGSEKERKLTLEKVAVEVSGKEKGS